MNLHLVMGLALLFEVAICLRARWHLGCRRYDTIGFAVVATHCRVVAVVFIYLGRLVLLGLRTGRYVVVKLGLVDKVVELAAGRYWRLHGHLEDRFIVLGARYQRLRHLRKLNVRNRANSHTPLAIWLHGTGAMSRSGDVESPVGLYSGLGGEERAVGSWQGRAASITLGLVAGLMAALVLWVTGWYRLPGLAGTALGHLGDFGLALLVCIAVGLALGVASHHGQPGGSTHNGFARRRDIRRAVSSSAVRRSARVTRPAMSAKRLPVTHSGTFLGWHKGRRIWATLKDVVLVLAPPQTGKTAYLGGRIIEAPGSVLATSTKADIYVHTAALRAKEGPVWVLNPEGLGGITSNFRWSPLDGCIDPEVASERAGYLLAGIEKGGGENAVFWREMNAKLLRCLLLAAAVSGRNMRDVWAWINDSADPTPLRIMETEPCVPASWVSELEQLMNDTPERTRQSVYLTLAQAMQFVTSPAIAATICPAPGEETFDLGQFLASAGTLYLLGSDRPYASLVPLFTAITGHVFEGAKRLAGRSYNGRLDPPLLLALDEAALICPVPLPSMTADSGGRGIQVMAAVQSPSQLYETWGQRGGETIYNNSNAKLIFGGLAHGQDLADLSKVCGERDDITRSQTSGTGGHHSASTSVRRVPVLAPHEIRQIADGTALLLYRNMPPVVIRIEKVWERKDVKRMAGRVQRGQVAIQRPDVMSTAAVRAEVDGRAAQKIAADVDNVVALPVHREDDDQGADEAAAVGEE